jgi:hypothetical protein
VSTVDREIATKLDDVVKKLLSGAASDYAAYASLVARYRVLKELADFMDEQRAAKQGDDPPDAED